MSSGVVCMITVRNFNKMESSEKISNKVYEYNELSLCLRRWSEFDAGSVGIEIK